MESPQISLYEYCSIEKQIGVTKHKSGTEYLFWTASFPSNQNLNLCNEILIQFRSSEIGMIITETMLSHSVPSNRYENDWLCSPCVGAIGASEILDQKANPIREAISVGCLDKVRIHQMNVAVAVTYEWEAYLDMYVCPRCPFWCYVGIAKSAIGTLLS